MLYRLLLLLPFLLFSINVQAQDFNIKDNGVVTCEGAEPGDTATLSGTTYTAVNRSMLDSVVDEGGDVTKVCTSLITDMSELFQGKSSFNGDISSWDVSSVTDMSKMFWDATSFNDDLSSWDVSSVTNMSLMFSWAESFNGNLSSWNVSSVNNMAGIFYGAMSFNGDLSSWDVSSVTNMRSMYSSAESFNGDLSTWDVSSVTNMNRMFQGATSFNSDLSSWDVSSATTMERMFQGATTFNSDLSGWCVALISDKPANFAHNSGLTDDHLPIWGTCPGKMYIILNSPENESTVSTTPTLNWQTDSMADSYQLQISKENSSTILDTVVQITSFRLSDTLQYGTTYTWKVRGINANNVGEWSSLWSFTTKNDIDNAVVTCNGAEPGDKVTHSGTTYTVVNRAMLDSIISEHEDTTKVCTSLITDMGGLFLDYDMSDFNGDLYSWDVSSVTDMESMFRYAKSFDGHLNNWDVSSVTNMKRMFYSADNFNGDLSTWDVSSVTNMHGMFQWAKSFSGNLSSWDVSSVTNMAGMFIDAESFNSDLSSWDVSSVSNMDGMFSGANSFNSDLSSWDISSVTNMSYMFEEAKSFNSDLSSWDVSSVTNMEAMFKGATSFDSDLSSWCVALISDKPENFAHNSGLTDDYLPIWGTCPSKSLTLVSPANLSKVSRTPSFTWQADSAIDSFQLRISRSDDSIVIETVVQTTSFSLTDTLQYGTTYTWRVRKVQADTFGTWTNEWSFTTGTESSINDKGRVPKEFTLQPNYPNPFNPSTRIRYSLPKAAEVRLTVYNSMGRSVRTLVNEKQPAGSYKVTFYAKNLPSGIYIYRLKAGSFSDTGKMMLLK